MNLSQVCQMKGYKTYAGANRVLNETLEKLDRTNVRGMVIALETGRFVPALTATSFHYINHLIGGKCYLFN